LLRNPQLIIPGALNQLYEKGHIGKIPVRSFSSIASGRSDAIRLQHLDTDQQGITLAELCFLSWMVSYFAPLKIFEFGTADGRTTLNLALNSPDICEIYTIDLPRESRGEFYRAEKAIFGEDNYPIPFKESIGVCFKDHPIARKITQIYGDTTNFDFSPYLGKMDLIFIDANHGYEFVKSDTENALKMLSSRGIIVWHDYPYWEGVRIYLDELHEGGLGIFRIQDTKLACYISAAYA
jgi:hypothetical protein